MTFAAPNPAMRRRSLLLGSSALVPRFGLGLGAGLGLLPATSLATPIALDEQWPDEARQRDLPVRLRWPEGEGPCGLIVQTHGLGGNRDGGDVWGRAWQQAGFAVLHLQHPGSDTEVLDGGMQALRAAANTDQLMARVRDMQFAVDEVERRVTSSTGAWSRVRLDALGASGHSFGAATVQALAGQRFRLANAGLAEPRFKAFVAFSPSPGQGVPVAQAFAGVTRPFLVATGSLDSDPVGRGLTGADRASVHAALPHGRRGLLWLEGADHMSFAGNAEQRLRTRTRTPTGQLKREPLAAEREPSHHALIAAITSLWWRATLLDNLAATVALRAPALLRALREGDRWQLD